MGKKKKRKRNPSVLKRAREILCGCEVVEDKKMPIFVAACATDFVTHLQTLVRKLRIVELGHPPCEGGQMEKIIIYHPNIKGRRLLQLVC